MTDTKTIYIIRVNYKSGKTEEFECLDFKVSGGSKVEWVTYGANGPLFFNFSEVESIWQVGIREVNDD